MNGSYPVTSIVSDALGLFGLVSDGDHDPSHRYFIWAPGFSGLVQIPSKGYFAVPFGILKNCGDPVSLGFVHVVVIGVSVGVVPNGSGGKNTAHTPRVKK